MERLITCKEASAMLGYSKDAQCRYIKGLRKKGLLTGARFGNKLMFKEQDVLDFIERQFKIQNR